MKPPEHDGNNPICGCDCAGCLGLIPGTKMYELNEEFLNEDDKREGEKA